MRKWIGSPSSGLPSSRTVPAVACTTPVMTRSIVVLPAPFGPIRPSSSPCCTSKDTSLMAVMPPKRTVTAPT